MCSDKDREQSTGVDFLRQFAGLKILVVDLIIYRVIRGDIGLVVGSLWEL